MPQGLNILGATVHSNVCKVQYENASCIELNSSTAESIFCQNPKIICEFATVYQKKNLLEENMQIQIKKKNQYIAFQYTLFPAHKALDISKNITVYILQALHRFILLDEHPQKSDSIFPGNLYPVLLQLCDVLAPYLHTNPSLTAYIL